MNIDASRNPTRCILRVVIEAHCGIGAVIFCKRVDLTLARASRAPPACNFDAWIITY